jgi:hypothetical protein
VNGGGGGGVRALCYENGNHVTSLPGRNWEIGKEAVNYSTAADGTGGKLRIPGRELNAGTPDSHKYFTP